MVGFGVGTMMVQTDHMVDMDRHFSFFQSPRAKNSCAYIGGWMVSHLMVGDGRHDRKKFFFVQNILSTLENTLNL
jgi:hypothetical protein